MIRYIVDGPVDNQALDALFDAAWPNHTPIDFAKFVASSLFYILAYRSDALVGFVRVIGDGGIHGFILEPTVHPDAQRQNIGTTLLREAATAAKARGVEWLHVDFLPELTEFYRRAGFRHTAAGLLQLSPERTT